MAGLDITSKIKQKSYELGFSKVGIVAVCELRKEGDCLQKWLQDGYHADMAYLERRVSERIDPKKWFSSAASVICLAMNYYTPFKHSDVSGVAKISRYAWGDDYHDIITARLNQLLDYIRMCDFGKVVDGKIFVDSSPVMEREWAIRAGIGWRGKNGLVITKECGSWCFLGGIMLNVPLDYDRPMKNQCGTCTRCMEACPTNAIEKPGVINATKCISYQTIERKSAQDISEDVKPRLDGWIFGCDRCQDVCPFNAKYAVATHDECFYPRRDLVAPDLMEFERMTEDEFRDRFKKNPIKRAKYNGFMRNIKAARGGVLHGK